MIYSIIVLVGFERHIINSCDSDLCFVPETHYFNLLPMKRRQVLLSDDGRKLKRIHAEGATPKTSQRTIVKDPLRASAMSPDRVSTNSQIH